MSANPVVSLGGKSYPVPPMVPRQMRIALPAMLRVVAMLKENEEGWLTSHFDDLYQAIWWGVIEPNGGTPTFVDFCSAQITFPELMAAFRVVQHQSGMFVVQKEGAPGEAPAA